MLASQQQPSVEVEKQPVSSKKNRLANETSPYLRQHATNPVDWYPWGEEALARSKREDKPIFLSVGYSACHWCHVMEHESFEDEATAALMNAEFVCIKVDREERPEIDEIYMAAVQAMTGQGGWPMSVWLTPDLQPFFGGTYYPPKDMAGRPGFPRVLQQLAKVWKERREDCVRGAQQLTDHLQKVLQPADLGGDLPKESAATMRTQSEQRYDELHGGFASAPAFAPKFPHASELQVLLRSAKAGDERARVMAINTLDRMASGGMYDQIGFGFHRYSTDREWLVPHFEKMLYDNALLVPAYLDAHALDGGERHVAVARQTLDYMLRELQDPLGGFWSSQDADSEGVEGKFFVWQLAEIESVVGADAVLAAARWGASEKGNWEHTNVLWSARSTAQLAKDLGQDESEIAMRTERARELLLTARSKRVRPGTDDKVLAAWNGMAIAACAHGYLELSDRRYLDAARRAAEFVLTSMFVDGRLRRSWHSGKAQGPAFLEDYALVADSLITLFEADPDPRWLEAARLLLSTMIAHYGDDESGAFFFTSDDHEALLARSRSATESSTPSGSAVAARALLRAGLLLADEALYQRGERVLAANAVLLRETPIAVPSLVLALQFAQSDPREIVVAGDPDDSRTKALLAAVRGRFPRDFVLANVHDGNRSRLEKLSPVFVGKEVRDGVPAAYVCRRGVCESPITDPVDLQR
ncbi:MAG: thioredoxin domain-containing protein [Planctomycetota bacterium]